MNLVEVSQVALEDLPIPEFRAHLRLGTGFGEDGLQDVVLEGYLRAAIAAVEARTGKVILAKDFEYQITSWKAAASHPLPVAPVLAIVQLRITDLEGTVEDLGGENYGLMADQHRPRLHAVSGHLPRLNAGETATIAFQAGHADWTGVPADLQQAVLLLAAHYYEYRNETALVRGCMPFGVTSLIERHRAMRLGGAQ